MNSALKHTIIAAATAALSVTAGCKSDDGPEASEVTAGAETVQEAKAEGSCGEGSCGAEKKAGDAAEGSCGEGSCGEGSCGGAKE
ncbi:MAG: low-complexity protein [Polyangiales bacterium]